MELPLEVLLVRHKNAKKPIAGYWLKREDLSKNNFLIIFR